MTDISKDLASLVRDFFTVMDIEEESDNGVKFKPTHITSCRTFEIEKLNKILPKMRELSKEEYYEKGNE